MKTVAFLSYPGLTPLDLVGPLQVMSDLSSAIAYLRPEGVEQVEVKVVAATREATPTDTPLRIAASHTFEEVPRPDVLVVPGGGLPAIAATADEQLINYVRESARTAEVTASVCTGALILAAAGLLDGKPATTHWAYYRQLERLGATYRPERWVDNGRVICAAGVSAGIDMALFLSARLAGEQVARLVQLGIEYDPHPPFGPIDWSGVDRDMYGPVFASIQQPLRDALSARPGMFERLFPEFATDAVGTS
ncbi:MAG TPA: DJ-1/PfpI family protein [Deinococcales bacterium]|nr:DJ-1/PfpI family protein [Deinococcales bacterium]